MNRTVVIIFHYAVWKAPYPYMWPACKSIGEDFLTRDVINFITVIRGHVNCPDCLHMMGAS